MLLARQITQHIIAIIACVASINTDLLECPNVSQCTADDLLALLAIFISKNSLKNPYDLTLLLFYKMVLLKIRCIVPQPQVINIHIWNKTTEHLFCATLSIHLMHPRLSPGSFVVSCSQLKPHILHYSSFTSSLL